MTLCHATLFIEIVYHTSVGPLTKAATLVGAWLCLHTPEQIYHELSRCSESALFFLQAGFGSDALPPSRNRLPARAKGAASKMAQFYPASLPKSIGRTGRWVVCSSLLQSLFVLLKERQSPGIRASTARRVWYFLRQMLGL